MWELNLQNKPDIEIFKQAMRAAAKLANAGLTIGQFLNFYSEPRVDLFALAPLKGGGQKLLVQDIDTLFLSHGGNAEAFRISSQNLVEANSVLHFENRAVAQQIAKKVAKEFGFGN